MSLSRAETIFLVQDSEVGRQMSRHNWSESPLGLPETWPQSLCSVVSLMLHSTFPMFLAYGSELGFLYNDSYAEILGNKHPSALGRRFRDIWAEIWDDIFPLIEHTKTGQGVYRENLPLTVHRNGFDEQGYFTFSYSPLIDESGRVAGMFCACIETTAAVLAERHRQDENNRLRQLFEQSPGIMAVLRGPRYEFELVNKAYLELVGQRVLVGKPIREALPELEGQGFFELLDQVRQTGKPFVGRSMLVTLQREKEGEPEERYVDFVYQPIRDYDGSVSGIFVEGSDVTEVARAFQALRESEERLRQFANIIHHLAWITDANGEVNWYNDRWYEYTGTTSKEMQGWGWSKVVRPDALPEAIAAWKNAVATGNTYEITLPIRNAHGEFHTFFARAAPVRDAAGKITQWFGTNTNITDYLKAQEELKAADRQKDEFLAMLAHELRNPLAPISPAAELLKLAKLDPARIQQTSDIITRQVSHLTGLVDDLLDVSRVTRGLIELRDEAVELNGSVADALGQVVPLIETKRQHLHVQLPEQRLFAKGDRTRLTQIFWNILNNAAKYTFEQGHITAQLEAINDEVLFSVQDSGIGIATELQPHIFNLFVQAQRTPDRAQGGLGLGLALVKNLVHLHGGHVSVHSEGVDKGSRFLVRLPLLRQETKTPNSQAPSHRTDAVHKQNSILVVDDNEDAALMLSMLLETSGHRVSVAYTGQQALQLAARDAPQILFLDIGLPDMDGYALARHLRKMLATDRAFIVAVTGYGQAADKEQAALAGFDCHFVKPVEAKVLLGLLEKIDQRQ